MSAMLYFPVSHCLGPCAKSRHYTGVSIAVAAVIAVVALLGVTAFVFAFEDWSFGNCFYYTFVTLSSIGLGDFVVRECLPNCTH